MSEPRLTHDCDRSEGPGLAPLLLSGVVAGIASTLLAGLLGAGWLLLLASSWLGGTAGLLRRAGLRCGPTAASPACGALMNLPALAVVRRVRR
jgi:hypothetical protein